MGEMVPNTPSLMNPTKDRLDSWKEIASYLNRDITTVQRWERREGMPVHRHLHDRKGSVYAFKGELDAWTRSRRVPGAEETVEAEETNGAVTNLPSFAAFTPISRNKWKMLLPVLLVSAALAIAVMLWIRRSELFWRDPLAGAHFQPVTDWDGMEQAATISRDGHFVAFLSNRDQHTDVWVTQVGSGEFHNLSRGAAPEMINPSVRVLGFSPDDSLLTFWVRRPDAPNQNSIGIWSVPTLGGEPRAYLEGAAEYDWSGDGRLAYHTPGSGDPLYVTKGEVDPSGHPIFAASAGLHSHFPLWSPDGKFLYVVLGSLPDKLDIWRIRATGGGAERITSHNSHVSYPVFLDQRTLLYLASNPDGSGPSLYCMDVERRVAHRLTPGLDRYMSLAASGDARRLVLTIANPKKTLWRLRIDHSPSPLTAPIPIPLTTSSGSSPRLGQGYLVYVSASGGSESLWKLFNGAATELWRAPETRIIGGPAISADGRHIAISVQQHGRRALLYVLDSDGTTARVVSDSLDLRGDPAWAPDMQSITTAANEQNVPRLFRVPVNGGAPVPLVNEYSLNPTWAGKEFVVFSGPDIGTKFALRAANADGSFHPLPELNLTRGARHVAFFPNEQSLIVLKGEIHHKDLWLINPATGTARQLTHLPSDFDVVDFDLSPDGSEVVLERFQDRSDVVLLDLKRP